MPLGTWCFLLPKRINLASAGSGEDITGTTVVHLFYRCPRDIIKEVDSFIINSLV